MGLRSCPPVLRSARQPIVPATAGRIVRGGRGPAAGSHSSAERTTGRRSRPRGVFGVTPEGGRGGTALQVASRTLPNVRHEPLSPPCRQTSTAQLLCARARPQEYGGWGSPRLPFPQGSWRQPIDKAHLASYNGANFLTCDHISGIAY